VSGRPEDRTPPASGPSDPSRGTASGTPGASVAPAAPAPPRDERRATAILRPPGLIVFVLFLLLVALLWWLFADMLVERSVEGAGESIVGARVDLAAADIRPTEGSIRLTGLAVTNPGSPMTNLFEAEEILVDVLLEPLLTKKVVVQQMAVTGVRFNTPREESGELDDPPPGSGALWRQVNAWAERVEVPPLSLEGLSTVVRTDAISADSLRTVQRARMLAGRADSLRTTWQAQLEALDPRPRIDSLEAVVQRIEEFRLTPLSATQVPGLVRDGRAALDRVTSLQEEIRALDDNVRDGVSSLREGVGDLEELRAADLAYARGLLNIPSLEGPEISPALFGGTAMAWLKPVLYWAQTAERFLPPGLDPRNRPGPKRTRAEGTTVEFPGRAAYPSFLVEQGEVGLQIAGEGAAAGLYSATLRNLTSQPTLVGAPMELLVGRQEGVQGPEGLSLAALLDHTTAVIRDSVALSLTGVGMPALDLDAFGGRLALGQGDVQFGLSRVGEEISARMRWASDDLEWIREGVEPAATPSTAEIGSADWARDFVWRAISDLRSVELEMGLSGSIDSPSVTISSNIGSAVGQALRNALGDEIEAAEARVRAEVDQFVQPPLQEARSRVDAVQTQVAERIGAQRAEVDDLRARLEERLEALVPGGG